MISGDFVHGRRAERLEGMVTGKVCEVLGLFFLSMSTRKGIAITAASADLVCYAYLCNDRGRVGGVEFRVSAAQAGIPNGPTPGRPDAW